jgi:hypothetical protein
MQSDPFSMSPIDHTTDTAGASSLYDPQKWLSLLGQVPLPIVGGNIDILQKGLQLGVTPDASGSSPVSKAWGAVGDAITPGWFKAFLAWFDGLRLITVLLGLLILAAGLFAIVAGEHGDTTVNFAAAAKSYLRKGAGRVASAAAVIP